MKKSRFSEEQIIGMIEEQERGLPTAEMCRKHGISTASFHKYESRFGGMDVSDARKLKAFEDANARRKKLLAEQMLKQAMCAIGSSRMASAMLKDVASRKW